MLNHLPSLSALIGAYYGLDWAATLLTVIALYLLALKKRSGFVVMGSSNLIWLAVAWISGMNGMLAANIIILCMNTQGYIKWGRTASESEEPLP